MCRADKHILTGISLCSGTILIFTQDTLYNTILRGVHPPNFTAACFGRGGTDFTVRTNDMLSFSSCCASAPQGSS